MNAGKTQINLFFDLIRVHSRNSRLDFLDFDLRLSALICG